MFSFHTLQLPGESQSQSVRRMTKDRTENKDQHKQCQVQVECRMQEKLKMCP